MSLIKLCVEFIINNSNNLSTHLLYHNDYQDSTIFGRNPVFEVDFYYD